MKTLVVLLLGCILACTSVAHGEEMHSHPVPEKLGKVHFSTSCAPAVSHDFERAVALLHSFAYTPSEQAFQHVSTTDPGCAMAYWGMAMSHFHQLWGPPDPQELASGQAQAARATQLGAKTERERLLIAAIAAYYHDAANVPPPARAKAYAAAMSVAAGRYPHDTEVQVFYALSLLAIAAPEDKTHARQKRAGAILETIWRQYPDHPGVAHYLIHAYDSAELAQRGLAPARAYAKIAPSAPHALHMPSHIFTRLGLWDDSIASNLAARAAAHSQGDLGEELHAMDYLTYAYIQRGRRADAQQVVQSIDGMPVQASSDFKVGYAVTAMPVRLAMEDRQWNAAARLPSRDSLPPEVASIIYWAHAVANARSGHAHAADADIARLDTCRQQLAAGKKTYWATQADILGKEARAWQSVAAAHPEQGLAMLRQAADEEDAIEKLPLTPGPIIPAREQLGDLYLQMHQPRQALDAYKAALISAPGRRGSMQGATLAAAAMGDARTVNHMQGRLSR